MWCNTSGKLSTLSLYLFVLYTMVNMSPHSMFHAINLNNDRIVYQYTNAYTTYDVQCTSTRKHCVCWHALHYCKSISTILNVGQIVGIAQSFRCNCGWIQIISTMLSLVYSWDTHCRPINGFTIFLHARITYKHKRAHPSVLPTVEYVCTWCVQKALHFVFVHHASNNKSIWMACKRTHQSDSINL